MARGGVVTVQFTVFGVPQTKGSTRAFSIPGRRFPIITNDNPKNKPWAQLVAAEAQRYRLPDMPWKGPISLRLQFVVPAPKSLPKRRLSFATKKPDLDKMIRSVKDSLKGVLYGDDSQVIVTFAEKRLGNQPGVTIECSTYVLDDLGFQPQGGTR